MAAVRQRFWPLSLRSAVRKIINNCIKCFKARPSISEAEMACLPSPRVTVSRPFTHCGVDYAGPVTLREGRRRNSRNHKAYVAAFVCFSTKAVHLELVSDLTTDAFIASLRRLIARRGRPERMYSDNTTTFVGAQRQIKEFYEFLRNDEVQNSINRFLLEQHTTWTFIPPNAPHFGGLWEAAIKSAKFYITRIIGGSHLTYEEFQTILSEIEAILNSRPLQPLSSDPNDMSYLSPGHFLVGTTLNSFPHPDLTNVNLNRLQRWQVVQQMRQHFWARWSAEYLNSLQERHKWKRNKGPQLEPGQLVLIKQAGLAPLQWLTGRVESVHPGPDGTPTSVTNCCRLSTPLTPEVTGTLQPFSFGNMTTHASASSLSRSQPQPLMGVDVLTNELLQKLVEQHKVSDAKFSAFIEEQRRTNQELNTKLNQLNVIAGNVERNGQRISSLEQSCAALDVGDMRKYQGSSGPASHSQPNNVLIISGVPSAMSITSLALVHNVFTKLGIPELSCHNLYVRSFVSRVVESLKIVLCRSLPPSYFLSPWPLPPFEMLSSQRSVRVVY
ncbi:uncharacterized protein LOC118645203 [Monomorium pharaonis]|uniref:uncharacterized protein LOC118645203 n=1 Tax=Monomorium pharaonis TaxID=307658 RepID=UPI001747CC4D|nr:uncharacterized protein LOC118645203 [Monomorium pharaonis]